MTSIPFKSITISISDQTKIAISLEYAYIEEIRANTKSESPSIVL